MPQREIAWGDGIHGALSAPGHRACTARPATPVHCRKIAPIGKPGMAAAPPAYLRRTNRSIPLLPSGPGGIFDLPSRRRQRGRHELDCKLAERAGYVRIVPDAHPSLRSGPTFGCPNSFLTNLSNPAGSHPPPVKLLMLVELAERAGFEPAKRFDPLTHFPGVLLQPLGHLSNRVLIPPRRDCSQHPCCSPLTAFGANLRLSKFVPDEFVEPAKRFDPLTHFPGVLLQPLGHLSTR